MSASLLAAIRTNDATEVARLLEANPAMKATLDGPLPGYSFGQTALMAAAHLANRDMMDVLLRAGADINQKSHWWAGPFHVLDGAARVPWLPSFLIGRGAVPEIHHLVQFGMMEEVRRALAENRALVHARGGDGQLPLHVAQTVEMADYLIDRGADVDARDVDHESSAAQYMVRDRPRVARHLVGRGAAADVLMAAALGDADRLRSLVAADPASIRTRVSPRWFPMRDRRAGGTIYIWTLGGEKGAHEIAREFGHDEVLRELAVHSPPSLQLAAACQAGDDAAVAELRARQTAIDPDDHVWLTAAASRNQTLPALRMLEAGWPANAGDGQATALHWAAFHGNADLVAALLDRGARRDARDAEHHGTPSDWARHGAGSGSAREGAHHAAVLDRLRTC